MIEINYKLYKITMIAMNNYLKNIYYYILDLIFHIYATKISKGILKSI